MAISEQHINPFLEMLMKKLPTLLRGKQDEFDAYLTTIDTDVKVLGTKANVHCHMIAHDGNEMPRVKDLAAAIALRIMEYAIPRSEIASAMGQLQKTNSPTAFAKLEAKARGLFTSIKNTGEVGELLLYVLIQYFLGIPQVLCKMPLKTSSQMHVHGSDGIHAKFDPSVGKLALYWGEAKLYQSIDSAIANCLDSIQPFFDDGGSDSARTRDLQLLREHVDFVDEELEDAFITFLDPDHRNYKKLEYRGACLIGFDSKLYPTTPNTTLEADVALKVNRAFSRWQSKLAGGITSRTPLDKFVLEVFFIPFPSVQEFRDFFLKELGNV